MFDVLSCLATMKASWIRGLRCVESSLKDFVLNMYPDFANLRTLGGRICNVLMQKIQNPFWRDVLKHYKKCTENPVLQISTK